MRFITPLFFLVLSFSAPARADWDVARPMIEVGGGMENDASDTVSVLLRVGFEGVPVFDENNHSLMIAKFRGNLTTNPASGLSGADRLPYMDIEFVAVSMRRGEGLSGGEWRFLPGHISRNIRLNEQLTVRVNVIGIQKNYLSPLPFGHGRFMAYASLAADALGLKMASYVSDVNRFYGLSAVAAAAEVGVVVRATDSLKVRIAFGGAADVNLGGNVGNGEFTLQSDASAYSEISLDVKRFLRFFVRNGINNADDSHHSSNTEYQLMIGTTFIF